MTTIKLVPLLLAFCQVVAAQNTLPVKWKYSVEKMKSGDLRIHIIANIDQGWHIYSQHQPKGAISTPTNIVLDKSPLVMQIGPAQEQGQIVLQEIKSIDLVQNTFERQVEFIVPIRQKTKVKCQIKGQISYQACTDQECLKPATEDFTLTID